MWRRTNPYPWIVYTEDTNTNEYKIDQVDPNNTDNLSFDNKENYSYYSSVEQGHKGEPDIFLLDIKQQ